MPNPNFTDEQLIAYMKIYEKSASKVEFARKLEKPVSTAKGIIIAAQTRGLTGSTKLDEVGKLKLRVQQAEADARAAIKEADTAEKIREELYKLAARSPEPPAWLSSPKHKIGKRGIPCTIWSDWHYGEVVRPEEVGGVNDFNMAVAKRRITQLVDTTIDLCRNHMGRADTVYPGIVVMLGGDMISGDIHEELFATNDRTTQQCINDLTDLLASALGRLADEFGRVFVPCVVGNHGRASRKPRMKGRVYTSHEWNIYCNLERYFKGDKRVQFFIPGESDAYFKVYNHKYLLTHGDSLGVKGGDGIIGSLGPIMRGSIKTSHSEAQIGRDFDTVVMGHWHQSLWLPGVIVNNALKGYDEFARLALRAPYSRPSQQLWFTHPEHGITARWEVFLDKPRKAGNGEAWISWQPEKKR